MTLKQATALEDLRTCIVNEKKLVHTPDAALVAYDKVLKWIEETVPEKRFCVDCGLVYGPDLKSQICPSCDGVVIKLPLDESQKDGAKCPNCDTIWPLSKTGSQCQRCDSITILPYNPQPPEDYE